MVNIKHKNTDFGYTITGCSFDEYLILHDGKEIAVLRYDIRDVGDRLQSSWSLTWEPGHDCCSTPAGFMGADHIISSAIALILRDFSEDDSFYFESFYTEDDDRIEKELHPLSFM